MDATMEHLNGIELVDYIGGQFSSERQRQIAGHLNTCGECRRRCHEVRQNWRLLGEWQTDLAHADHPAPAREGHGPDYLADGDVADSVLGASPRAGAVPPADNRPPTRLRRLMCAAKAAGAALLAATTGRPPAGRGDDRTGFGA
jgi:hypothetical protein